MEPSQHLRSVALSATRHVNDLCMLFRFLYKSANDYFTLLKLTMANVYSIWGGKVTKFYLYTVLKCTIVDANIIYRINWPNY